MIEFVILIILSVIYLMTKPKNVYQVAYELGVHFLNTISIAPSGVNYAVMFDIDDTLIFSETNKPIKPIIKLIKECNDRNIKVLIITARDSVYTRETMENLIQFDIYPNPENPEFSELYNYLEVPKKAYYYDFIYLRHSPQENNEYFKSKVKEKLAEYNVYTIMSIGDNDVDVNGEFSGYSIKLPNIRKDDSRYDPRLFHKDASGKMVNVKIN